MGVPDDLVRTRRSKVHLRLSGFLERQIVAAYRERVMTCTFGGNSQYEFVVYEILRRHFEVKDAVRTQIDIIRPTREDSDTGVYRALAHIVVTFRQANIEFAVA